MTNVIKPTIGRIVWFWGGGAEEKAQSCQPLPAIVNYVHGDECVGLTVFGSGGSIEMPSVFLRQPGVDDPSHRFCEWMPYQVGQARKHAAEDEIKEGLKTLGQKFDVDPATPELELGDKAAAAVQKPGKRRVSLESMKDKIVRTHYTNPSFAPHVTTCLLLLENGYVLQGMSAPADPENFDGELGRKFAFEDALRKLWPLEGYLLREEEHRTTEADAEYKRAAGLTEAN